MTTPAQRMLLNPLMQPTRAAGLATLDAFQPRMGRRYASGRNYDLGPGRHKAVSQLSPYIRRRLVTEQEAVAAAVTAHGLEGAEKFIQEVFWRGYFKGWLERRPSIWRAYQDGLADDRARVAADRRLMKRIAAAEEGRTGLDCFDAWALELVETGYLHNHARMWFASIWIFTLDLPWRLGADFFYRHLLDGDPASNTLSWRWVAGLHTLGKAYAAQAWNIAKYTQQRFQPALKDLVETVVPLEEPEPLPPAQPVRPFNAPSATAPAALLITEDDCRLEAVIGDATRIVGVATLATSHLRSDAQISADVAAFERGALLDAAGRLAASGAPEATALEASRTDELIDWAASSGAREIETSFVPVGPTRDWLVAAAPALTRAGFHLTEHRRPWDDLIAAHATAGFFKVKAKIPNILRTLEIEI